jgi:hypothetical protein
LLCLSSSDRTEPGIGRFGSGLPNRIDPPDVATLVDILHETSPAMLMADGHRDHVREVCCMLRNSIDIAFVGTSIEF